ncbi:Histone-lysine N-methyltransferase SETMAR [Araneus ventricosus]|uniref:Histone-lysine N-methyltransferase SETMAR n=1 Tax=Araneus ventricosus TaxID=182803 RepID=A0A4Y2CY75_ARAVE|nr:Histone-lysine N-methyltransferase SETMAR [Araneus ventricosus]
MFLHFPLRAGTTAVQITVLTRQIREVQGDGKISDRTAQNWYKRFKEGDLSLEIKPRSGRPSVVNLQDVKQKVEMIPTTSTRKLSEELGLSEDTICLALLKLQKTYKNSREILHELTPQQANQRLEICKTLLENTQELRFFKLIVTCDEKWIHIRNPDNRKQWLDVGQSAEHVAKQRRFERKFMIGVWLNFQQVIYFEIIPKGRSFNSEIYCEQLDRMHASLKSK